MPYTGLVVDARETGFRPCLKPEIYAPSELLYPGGAVDPATAVRGGYVRYYRQLGRAQQSARAGALPYTIKARGIYRGQRSLAVDAEAARRLKEIMALPDNFFKKAHVVIVF